MRTIPSLVAAAMLLAMSAPSPAAESFDSCTGFITALPTTLASAGRYCLNKDLSTALASGAAITVGGNNITIDCNGFRLGNLQAGPGSGAVGVATTKLNTGVTGCHFRGFRYGVAGTAADALRIEDNVFEATVWYGVLATGDGVLVRRNRFIDIGAGGTGQATALYLNGSGEIRGNLVEGVESPSVASGLVAVGAVAVVDNSVRGLAGGVDRRAIVVGGGGSQIVDGNRLQSTADTGTAVLCDTAPAAVRDNSIVGFSSTWPGCVDAGGNVRHPVAAP